MHQQTIYRFVIISLCLLSIAVPANGETQGNADISEAETENGVSGLGRGFNWSKALPTRIDGGAVHSKQYAITATDQDDSTVLRTASQKATTSAPASITELARALRHDPDLINEFVHDNIECYLIWGYRKAHWALIDGAGTAHGRLG